MLYLTELQEHELLGIEQIDIEGNQREETDENDHILVLTLWELFKDQVSRMFVHLYFIQVCSEMGFAMNGIPGRRELLVTFTCL